MNSLTYFSGIVNANWEFLQSSGDGEIRLLILGVAYLYNPSLDWNHGEMREYDV